MKLYEAIASIVKEFGREIVSNARVVNVLGDYNAFEESKTFKVIIKTVISEGYIEQITYVKDWGMSRDRIIGNFIAATSFNDANATYVLDSLAYGLGYTRTVPVYQPNAQAPSPAPNGPSAPAPSSRSSAVGLDKTKDQIMSMDESTFHTYKAKAESYLESVIEFRTDIEKELGVKITPYIEFDNFGNIVPKFEIDGKFKVKYDYAIMLNVLIYNTSNKMIAKEEIYTGTNKSSFEVVDTCISTTEYQKVNNIQRIVVYWEKN